jgi:hypothetical protein
VNTKEKKEPKEPLRIPLDFQETVADMLKVKPPPEKPDGGTKKSVKRTTVKDSNDR